MHFGSPDHPVMLEAIQPAPLLPLGSEADNNVYFYQEVTRQSCLVLTQQLRALDNTLETYRVTHRMQKQRRTPIFLHIQSEGGDMLAGFGMIDVIQDLRTPTISIINGKCASAATFIALACTERYITSHSYFLIHQLTSLLWGKHEEFKDEMAFQTKLMDDAIQFYADHSKLKKSDLRKRLKQDLWMNATETAAAGFAGIWLPDFYL